jgi:hypothetical protein
VTGGMHRTGPWIVGDRYAVVTVNVLAVIVVAACWLGVATEVHWRTELYWLQGAIVAAVVAAIADATWLLTGMRQLRGRRRQLVDFVPQLVGVAAPTVTTALSVGPLVTADRMSTYHARSCPLVQGKDVYEGPVEYMQRHGRYACGMCLS